MKPLTKTMQQLIEHMRHEGGGFIYRHLWYLAVSLSTSNGRKAAMAVSR
jgi:hypothetical protein